MPYCPDVEDLHAHLQIQIAIGYYDAEELVEETPEFFEVDEDSLRELVHTLTDEHARRVYRECAERRPGPGDRRRALADPRAAW